MVLQKRLDYGFIGYTVPPIPQARRSARRRGPVRKNGEDSRACAFDLLATIAGKFLLEEGNPPRDVVSERDHDANAQDGVSIEQCDNCEVPKVEHCDQGITEIGQCVEEHGLDSQRSACLLPASGLTTSDCSKVSSDDKAAVNNDRCDFISPRKIGGNPFYCRGLSTPKLEENVNRRKQSQQVYAGDASFGKAPDNGGSDDPTVLDRKPPDILVGSDSNGRFSICKDRYMHGSLPLCRDVTVVSRDDDENSSGCTQPSTTMKSTRPPSRSSDHNIRISSSSKYWKVASKFKDGDLSDNGGELLPAYSDRKNGYKRQRSQRIYPLKKRRLFDCSSGSNSEGVIGCKRTYESPERAGGATASDFIGAKRHGAAGTTSSIAAENSSFLSRSHVKLRIKSFRIPELFIELPETETVGSLKRTVLDAVTTLLGDGLHVGVFFQGRKIRDDNRTLLQSGISHDNEVDALGFTLEPSPSNSFAPLHSGSHPLLSDDMPLSISSFPRSTSITHQGALLPSVDNPVISLGTSIESDHDSAPSPAEVSTEKGSIDSGALVPIHEANAQALAVVPLSQRSKRTEMAQRRIRRPFSVSEVEALVQAVEKLGTGRWRDVKLRAFDNVKHRTYVDLKDKWKTLVHTARISPQQRRGEPVPQELLDRVLAAHAYWSQQQVKQQLKQQSEACLLA